MLVCSLTGVLTVVPFIIPFTTQPKLPEPRIADGPSQSLRKIQTSALFGDEEWANLHPVTARLVTWSERCGRLFSDVRSTITTREHYSVKRT